MALSKLTRSIIGANIKVKEVHTMSWYGDKVAKLKSLSNPYVFLYVTAKVLGGIGIGILLANWLSTWTWWIFMVIACVIAIPVVLKIFGR